MAKELLAWKWWMMNAGENLSFLQNIAMKVLSQCTTNLSLERNWSMYKYVHNTIKNCLLSNRAKKLVYIYCNERILKRIESESYEEEMPRWMYECNDDHSDNFDVEPITCTSTELEQNLSISKNDLKIVLTKLDKKILLRDMIVEEEGVPNV